MTDQFTVGARDLVLVLGVQTWYTPPVPTLKQGIARADTPGTPVGYGSEQALVKDLLLGIGAGGSPWKSSDVTTEFDYGRGRADVLVFYDGEVVAIEAKLTKWRHALDQAYRNTCFAHRSFVCLPEDAVDRAARYAGEFERRGVGLCTIRDGQIVVVHASRLNDPLQPWLSAVAAEAACSANILEH